jgi:hypothetical protein
MMNDLKIIGLKVDGFQNLSAVEMEFSPEGGCTFIRGANEQGKTSIIECLWWLFQGKSTINPEKIQHGKDKITGAVDLGEFTIERVQTQKSDRLEIKKKDGFEVTEKKQAFLDRLTNQLTFNPFPFLNLPPEKKLKFMMDFLNINFDEIDQKISQLEQERLIAGRMIKAIGEIPEVPKVEPVDVEKLLSEKNRVQAYIEAELESIRDFNDLQKTRNENITRAENVVSEWAKRVDDLQDELKLTVQRLEAEETALSKLPQPEPATVVMASQTTALIDQQILEADGINRQHEQWKEAEAKQGELNALNFKRMDFDGKIKGLRESKQRKLSETSTGVDGLKIRENGLYYRGHALENCSDSRKLRISMELCQAMNPPLKAVFVDRGESFDAARIAEIEQFAAENDIQVIITQVANEIPENVPDNVFYIVAGEIQ